MKIELPLDFVGRPGVPGFVFYGLPPPFEDKDAALHGRTHEFIHTCKRAVRVFGAENNGRAGSIRLRLHYEDRLGTMGAAMIASPIDSRTSDVLDKMSDIMDEMNEAIKTQREYDKTGLFHLR